MDGLAGASLNIGSEKEITMSILQIAFAVLLKKKQVGKSNWSIGKDIPEIQSGDFRIYQKLGNY